MAPVHIAATLGDVADTVFMPGDPRRAERIAERYLESPRVFNSIRGMTGISGTRGGRPLSVLAHGMGMPSIGIYATELVRELGVRTLVRLGSCGGLQPSVRLRDLVIAQTASTGSSWQQQYGIAGHFAPCADWELLSRAAAAAHELGLPHHVGGVLSTDVFYPEEPSAFVPWTSLGVLAAEMETAALYMIAARHKARALSILTVSDEIGSGAHMSPEERESTFDGMVELALHAAGFEQTGPHGSAGGV